MAQLRPKFNKERKNSNVFEKEGVGNFNDNMERGGLKIPCTPSSQPPLVDRQVLIRPLPLESVPISRSCGLRRFSLGLAVGSALPGCPRGASRHNQCVGGASDPPHAAHVMPETQASGDPHPLCS